MKRFDADDGLPVPTDIVAHQPRSGAVYTDLPAVHHDHSVMHNLGPGIRCLNSYEKTSDVHTENEELFDTLR